MRAAPPSSPPQDMVPTVEMRFVKRIVSNHVVPPLVANILQQKWVVATMPGWINFDTTFEWRDVPMIIEEAAANVSG